MEKNLPLTINEKDFTFFIDPKTGTTVAIMIDPLDYFERNLWFKFARKTPPVKGVVGLFYPNFEKHFNAPVKGKAKLHPSDVFSVEKGVDIARSKCLARFYKQADKIFADIASQLRIYAGYADNFDDKAFNLFQFYNNKIFFKKENEND